ncbi:thymidine phosphorylase [Microbulbifer sp. SH-1]|uniref:thymidine phosphorylase n=1 Tax=Microbulbifer sp. SH-1 TaxID=2681547 RepID=UPI001408878B|nr:thymidine phosphorylase [Microbulbifer sp. SH-1]QIL88486.1 thymidine phosphorylase [Microbulbifer sp. SH-1]
MLAQEIIHAKREGSALSARQIDFFVKGMMNESITEGQVAALAMAVFFRGLERPEAVALTRALQHSGTTLDWSALDLPGPVVDKHSSGGVGDKVSLMLAPMLAACGTFVPMISGRGLGHTGGTLDKMDSIPGYNTSPDIPTFQRVVQRAGCAIVGQTAELAPADKRLYGIRDVTATVESVPLITASILSKKLSAGLDSLVMDIKTGSGAFADNFPMAIELATSIVEVGRGLGLPISALITDMSQVLGPTAGNALEVREVVDYLRGDFRDPRLHQVVIALGAELLQLSGRADGLGDGCEMMERTLESGAACEYFAKMVVELGGPPDLLDRPDKHLACAPVVAPVFSQDVGSIVEIDVRAIGNTVVELGGGRRRACDPVDHRVGLSDIRALGDTIDAGTPLAMIHAASEADAERARLRLCRAFRLGERTDVKQQPVILERLAGCGVC